MAAVERPFVPLRVLAVVGAVVMYAAWSRLRRASHMTSWSEQAATLAEAIQCCVIELRMWC